MNAPEQQNPDGSFSAATPFGWQGARIDWEVYKTDKGLKACGYDEDVLVHVLEARTRLTLAVRIRIAERYFLCRRSVEEIS